MPSSIKTVLVAGGETSSDKTCVLIPSYILTVFIAHYLITLVYYFRSLYTNTNENKKLYRENDERIMFINSTVRNQDLFNR